MIVHHQKFELANKSLIERVTIKPPFRFAVDFPNEACFIFFGNGGTKVNSPVEQVSIQPDQSLLLKCGTFFADFVTKESSADEFEVLVVHLFPELLERLYVNEVPSFVRQAQNRSLIHPIGSHVLIQKFVESLYFYFENPSLVNEELLELKVKELVLLLVQTNNVESVRTLFSDLFTPRKVELREVVQSHLFSNLSINDLASLANMSTSTFKRNFHELFKDSPANYIRIQRLGRAKQLLTNSDYSINEIADLCCFSDAAHLSRSFKQQVGETPTDFRNSMVTN